MTFRRGRGGAAWRDPLRGKRGRVFYGDEALVWRLNTKYRADPNPSYGFGVGGFDFSPVPKRHPPIEENGVK